MRFGRAPSNDNANFIRFGRGGPDTNFMRFGRPSNGEDVRPAAPASVVNVPMVRLGRPSGGLDNNNFMRFGRGRILFQIIDMI
jgi:FMRFamide related peptide family